MCSPSTRWPEDATPRSCRAATSSLRRRHRLSGGHRREIERRLVQPWNEVLQEVGTAAAGASCSGSRATTTGTTASTASGASSARSGGSTMLAHRRGGAAHRRAQAAARATRSRRRSSRQLHLDELGGVAVDLAGEAYRVARALVLRRHEVRRARRLALAGLHRRSRRRPTGRCRSRRASTSGASTASSAARTSGSALFFAAAAGRGQPEQGSSSWRPIRRSPTASPTSRDRSCSTPAASRSTSDRSLPHRRPPPLRAARVGESLHVIAGGGGAFLHGTASPPSAARPGRPRLPGRGHQPPARARASRGSSLAGTAGFLPHMIFGLLGAIQIWAFGRGPCAGA